MSVAQHLPSRRDPRILAVLAVATILGARVESFWPEFNPDRSWSLGITHAVTHGIAYGRDFTFTYGPLSYLSIPMANNRATLALGLLWALAISAAVIAAVFILSRHIASLPVRLGLCVVAAVPLGLILRPETAVLALALWALVLLDTGEHLGARATTWLASMGTFVAVITLIKFSLAFGLVLLALLCAAAPHARQRLAAVAAGFIPALLVLWVATGQHPADFGHWLRATAAISAAYSTSQSFHHLDANASMRIVVMLAAALAIAVAIAWHPARAWRTERSREHAMRLAIIVAVVYFFLRQSFVRFTVPNTFSVYFTLGVLALAVTPHLARPTVRLALPAALVFGTLAQSLPPVRTSVDTWVIAREHRQSLSNLLDGFHRLVSPSYHRTTLAREWQQVLTDGGVPASDISARVGSSTVAVEPVDISVALALGLNWRPIFTLQSYQSTSAYLDDLVAAPFTGPNAPEFVLARYSTTDNRNQLWSSPRYQYTLACRYQLDATYGAWKLFRRANNICGTPVQIDRVVVGKNQPIVTPSRPNSLVYATFFYSTGLADKVSSALLRPIITPYMRLDNQRVRLVNNLISQPHIISEPAAAGAHAFPWGPITYSNIEFWNIPGDITVTFWEVPLTAG